jgi:putative ABC transport system ATP-binding protein
VFQSFNLIPTLTAEENIAVPLLAAGQADLVEQRIEPLLVRLGLAERRRHRPDALSGGEQQRVAIARALITDPAIVLADEPTGSLDSVTGQSICQLLGELCHEQGRTIVVVTHEPNVACWAQRVVIMKDGSLLADLAIPGRGDSQTLAVMYQRALTDSFSEAVS